MTEVIFNHFWQSTLFALAACVLIFLFRRGSSWSRHFIAWIAYAQFVIPITMLVSFMPAAPEETVTRELPLSFLGQAPSNWEASAGINCYLPSAVVGTKGISWPTVAGLAWFAGFTVLFSRRAFHYFRWREVVMNRSRPADASWNHLASHILRGRNRVLPHIVVTDDDCLHAGVFGLFNPTIVIPEEMEKTFDPDDREAFLRHELQHVLKHDNFFLHLQKLIRDLLWFHPLAYWLDRQISIEREIMRDEDVLRTTQNKESYINCLMKASKLNLSENFAAGVGIHGSSFARRLKAIASYRSSVVKHLLSAGASVFSVAALATVFCLATYTNQAQAGDHDHDGPPAADVPLQELLVKQQQLEEKLKKEKESIHKLADEHAEVVQQLRRELARDNVDWQLSDQEEELRQRFIEQWMKDKGDHYDDDSPEAYLMRLESHLKAVNHRIGKIKKNMELGRAGEDQMQMYKELKSRAKHLKSEIERVKSKMKDS